MKSKVIAQITDPAKLELAKKFLRARERMQKDLAAMEADYHKKCSDYVKNYNKEVREYYRACVGEHVEDPDDEFMKPNYFLDFQYADFGAVFIRHNIHEDETPQGEHDEEEDPSNPFQSRRIVVN